MPTALCEWYKSMAGPSKGIFDLKELLPVETATTTNTAGTIARVSSYEPWTHTSTAAIILRHPFAILHSLQVKVAPGPGIFGRGVVLHYGWSNSSMAIPTTTEEFSLLHGYRVHTFGGSADPGESDRTSVASFNEARSDILKTAVLVVGGRIRFHYFFTEADFTTTPLDGARFFFMIEGKFEAFGDH